MLTLISAIAASLLGMSVAFGQSFGRFGYTGALPVPGFEVDKAGFRVRHDAADWFRFQKPSDVWRPLLVNEIGQTVMLSGVALSPGKLKVDLLAPGFLLHFHYGFSFSVSSLSSPYLTWFEGSVGPGLPTPETSWVLVTFRDNQPPVLLAFPSSPQAVKITGKTGDWKIQSAKPFEGWVRICAPIGAVPFAANSVSRLGELVQRITSSTPYFVQESPRLLESSLVDDPGGVTLTWKFDRAGALLPTPATLAQLGGYDLKLRGDTVRLSSFDESGPHVVARGTEVSLRFPVIRIPTGRSLATGGVDLTPPATVSWADIPSVVELGLANLISARPPESRALAEQLYGEFMAQTIYVEEPLTQARLPFDSDGRGADLAAAHALLSQCMMTAEKATSEPNSLLTSLTWRRDWRTWRFWGKDPTASRRATAIAAVAGALCPEPIRRLDAAMFQAGLAAEEGLRTWQGRQGLPISGPPTVEPLDSLRRALFAMKPTDAGVALLEGFLSEIRVYGPQAFSASSVEGAVMLEWSEAAGTEFSVILASGYPVDIAPGENVDLKEVGEALGFTVVKGISKGEGVCSLRVTLPTWAKPLPKMPAAPRYSESVIAPDPR